MIPDYSGVENVIEKGDHPQALVDNALKILVRSAAGGFGFAPRGV